MKNLFILINLFYIVNISFGNWEVVNSGNKSIWNIKFMNSMTGFAVGGFPGESVALKTINGGYNWQEIIFDVPVLPNTLWGISFTKSNSVFLCGGSNRIYKSTNNGINWITQYAPLHGNTIYNDIFMASDSVGYLAGRNGYIIKTTNAGENWYDIAQVNSDATNLYFHNELTGFVIDASSYVSYTENGGKSWIQNQLADSLGLIYALNIIQFTDVNTGFICAYRPNRGCVFKTTNKGETWKNVLINDNQQFYNLNFLNNSSGFVTSNNKIFKTSNSGNTWDEIIPLTTSELYSSVYFLNETTVFLGGYLGNIYINKKGGVNITKSKDVAKTSADLLIKNYPNPFNSQTSFEFTFHNLNEKEYLKIELFNIAGMLIKTLYNNVISVGNLKLTWNASYVANGIYFVKVLFKNSEYYKKVLLLK